MHLLALLATLVAADPPPSLAPPPTPPDVEATPTPLSVAAPAAASLEGVVRDGAGAPVAGAMVLLDGEVVATTDAAGRFNLRGLAAGERLLSVMGRDGQDHHDRVVLAPGATVRRALTLAGPAVEDVKVVETLARPRRAPGEVTLPQRELAEVPGTFGDPVRVIENLPGASRAPGGAGGALIIRGANPADSAVLMDGVQIPLLYHFGGLTSVVSSEFLSEVTFLPGGFGAQYGRATAGVAEVASAALACDRLRASASVDPLDAEVYACLPAGRWRVAAAARRSYVDAFLPALLRAGAKEGESPTLVSPAYFDYQAKAERTWARHRVELFAFGSRDALKVSRATSAEDADLELGGTLAFHRLQVRHLYYGDRLTLESALVPGFVGQAFHDGSQDLETAHHSGADITSVEWRETATVRAGDWLTVRGGIDHVLTHWSADFVTDLPTLARRYPTPLPPDPHTENPWHGTGTGVDQAYWAELALRPSAALTITPGVRLANLVFDQTHRFVAEPRLAARWQATAATTLTAAGGVYRKLPDLFSGVLVHGFGQPNLDAERALHLVAGVERHLGPLEGKLEGFYVRRDHLPSPTDEVALQDGKAEPVLFRSDGRGRSYGLELLLRLPADDARRFSGWIAYTLSRSTRIDRLGFATGGAEYMSYDPGTPRLANLTRQSHEYVSPFDQTHILTAIARWELPWRMSLGGRFQLVTGNPTTPLDRGQAIYDADSDRYQVRPGSVAPGSDRLPTFHRLDLRVDKRWQFASWQLTAYLELMNAYNRRPVEALGYDYRYRTRTELRGLPVLPLLGLKGEL